MGNIKIDLSSKTGKVKPMHATNNGPVGLSVRQKGNKQAFIDAGIPYARLHDSAFYSSYGGEYIVDVHRIFRNFDADVNDPSNYDFEWTDKYIACIYGVGMKVFYRLGASIEHEKKVGTQVPKDYQKWAEICEHIIRHYNEGWADGFNYNIEYWEIWNEYDCRNADGSNPCWQGTVQQFVDFFTVVANHLKTCFPELKIGGPALCDMWQTESTDEFFSGIAKNNVKLDFVSYHRYCCTVEDFCESIDEANRFIYKYGYGDCEKILNEWNYIRGWLDDEWVYSLKTENNYKGASFIAGCFLASHYKDVDMLMYYEGRPCGMCGLFDSFLKVQKPYYTFKAFNELYKLGTAVKTEVNEDFIYALGATNGDEHAIMLTYFDDSIEKGSKTINIDLNGIEGNYNVEYYVLNQKHDLDLVKTKKLRGNKIKVKVGLYDVQCIKIVKNH